MGIGWPGGACCSGSQSGIEISMRLDVKSGPAGFAISSLSSLLFLKALNAGLSARLKLSFALFDVVLLQTLLTPFQL